MVLPTDEPKIAVPHGLFSFLPAFFPVCLRRSALVEGLMCEYQRGINGVHSQNDTDSEEGAKVFKLLETASEPELLMAEMSREQLTSFTTYKAKYEVEY